MKGKLKKNKKQSVGILNAYLKKENVVSFSGSAAYVVNPNFTDGIFAVIAAGNWSNRIHFPDGNRKNKKVERNLFEINMKLSEKKITRNIERRRGLKSKNGGDSVEWALLDVSGAQSWMSRSHAFGPSCGLRGRDRAEKWAKRSMSMYHGACRPSISSLCCLALKLTHVHIFISVR